MSWALRHVPWVSSEQFLWCGKAHFPTRRALPLGSAVLGGCLRGVRQFLDGWSVSNGILPGPRVTSGEHCIRDITR